MKVLLIAAICVTAIAAIPSGRKLRPEEHWRTSKPRDFSKFKPKHAMYPKQTEDITWEEQMIKINKEAKKLAAKNNIKMPQVPVSYAEECGIEGPPFGERIVGGVEAAEHQWPWIVALFIDDAWFCGGSLIGDKWVLTAAHCADGAFYFDVLAGAHNVRESSEPNRVEITSYNGFTHPGWDTSDLSNDVALIELPEAITWNDYIKPACLPSAGETANEGDIVTAIGWGKPSDSAGGISPVLRMVDNLPVISNSDCNDIYGIVGPGVVCIDTSGGRGTCNGDSGGPLNANAGGNKWTQIGVVSFGASAGCEVGYPAGFSRTEYYLDWIMSETGISA